MIILADQLQKTGLFKKPFTNAQVHSLQEIERAWDIWGDKDPRKLAYILATTYHETAGTMLPVKEYGGEEYLRSKKYWPYVGYGLVQLTWKRNYERVGKIIGEDLVDYPEKALDPVIASEIAVRGMMAGWFTGKKMADYIGKDNSDYLHARKIINGMDKAELIAGYALKIQQALTN